MFFFLLTFSWLNFWLNTQLDYGGVAAIVAPLVPLGGACAAVLLLSLCQQNHFSPIFFGISGVLSAEIVKSLNLFQRGLSRSILENVKLFPSVSIFHIIIHASEIPPMVKHHAVFSPVGGRR